MRSWGTRGSCTGTRQLVAAHHPARSAKTTTDMLEAGITSRGALLTKLPCLDASRLERLRPQGPRLLGCKAGALRNPRILPSSPRCSSFGSISDKWIAEMTAYFNAGRYAEAPARGRTAAISPHHSCAGPCAAWPLLLALLTFSRHSCLSLCTQLVVEIAPV